LEVKDAPVAEGALEVDDEVVAGELDHQEAQEVQEVQAVQAVLVVLVVQEAHCHQEVQAVLVGQSQQIDSLASLLEAAFSLEKQPPDSQGSLYSLHPPQ